MRGASGVARQQGLGEGTGQTQVLGDGRPPAIAGGGLWAKSPEAEEKSAT